MSDEVVSLLDNIKDTGLTSLVDISRLSYPTFLRRVGGQLSLGDCHHLYQAAIYHAGQYQRRETYTHTSSRLKQFICSQEPFSDNQGEDA